MYILGPGDRLAVRVGEVPEIGDHPIHIDPSGYISLPLVGRVLAADHTVENLEEELVKRYQKYLYEPDLTVSVVEFRSQPVSVVGAVRTPGVFQVEGRKTIVEVLSLAGGLDALAGPTLTVTRLLKWGRIPLPGAVDDESGRFSIATVNLKALLDAKRPEDNIPIMPDDVITVPRAEMVYVVGDVHRAGGFPMSDSEGLTILQALSLAGGLEKTSAPAKAKILRPVPNRTERNEVAVNIKAIVKGKAPDIAMQPGDILFIPGSATKSAYTRAVEAAIQAGTGVVIWRR